ncbi:hypothetical protein B0H66DRAFT_604264 [Apodospora peruviana]|uniref:Uncharacterized protein n=1 Tax=Apodospora peruviana TaxID=516989 RepID=A0AAE0HZR8_9PEZI|nr:hypothetical protein B0H66DRAFT_604264 [Apodospora peruviana]
MVSLTNVLVAIAAVAVSGVSAHTNCPQGRLLCGWVLHDGTYAYTRDELASAAQSQDDKFIYNSIYRCANDGLITWSTFCTGGDGHCQNIPAQNPDNFCR